MSKIFNVIKKYNIVDLAEMSPGEDDLVEHSASAVNGEARVPTLPPPTESSIRVARLRVGAESPICPFDMEHQGAAEQYRIIRTKILHHPKKPRVIVISSPNSGDGKTVTSTNIAASLALKDKSRVLLVDGDLRRPHVSAVLGIPNAPGLAEVLLGTAELDSALVRIAEFPNLFILPAGRVRETAAELLDSHSWRLFVERVRSEFSTIIFDAPPIALVADYELIQLVCDGTIVVLRPDHSERAACFKALETIPRDKLLGVVLNCVENWWLWKTSNYTYYRQETRIDDR